MKPLPRNAIATVRSCMTDVGFCAGRDYPQLWTRDFAVSVPILIKLGFASHVRKHIVKVLDRQQIDGEVPAVIYSGNYLRTLKRFRRFVQTFSYAGVSAALHPLKFMQNMQNWTNDSSAWFLLAIIHYQKLAKDSLSELDSAVCRLKNFVLSQNAVGSGMWDAMKNYSKTSSFLNSVLLEEAFRTLGSKKHVALDDFWNDSDGVYSDVKGSKHFDCLALALALKFRLVPEERISKVFASLTKAKTPCGYLNIYPAYSRIESEQTPYTYQNSTLWPFVESQICQCFIEYGYSNEAKDLREKIENRQSFNEWYSPFDGTPCGSEEQLFSATGYLSCFEEGIE